MIVTRDREIEFFKGKYSSTRKENEQLNRRNRRLLEDVEYLRKAKKYSSNSKSLEIDISSSRRELSSLKENLKRVSEEQNTVAKTVNIQKSEIKELQETKTALFEICQNLKSRSSSSKDDSDKEKQDDMDITPNDVLLQ